MEVNHSTPWGMAIYRNRTPDLHVCLDSEPSMQSTLSISYEELARATDGFADARLLGAGGFGRVYRARIANTDMAVKVLKEVRGRG